MKYFSFINFGLIAVIILLLNACNTPAPTTDTPTSPLPSPSIAPTENVEENKTESNGGQGGQVVEVGPYHLELATLKEAGGFHLDFYLQKGTDHTPIPNATVTGKIQLPDGTQQNIDFKYSDKDKHYTALFSTQIVGDYKLAILSDINGEKINGRFNFKY
ncbi:hypothetical protein H6G45_00790 [Synechocystis sp. FACHB-383]|jgi:hypothetical protein|uniref:hypothetical protein n=1 Tax=Synechocystis sp. FACHB-383 TaxID=2692864 RepID=UPI001684F306|nr:hypothetical protein [Synechocystis sp. FACHB-383]MBD2652050.1 hypothetical protein [Synechocystis sp. FACHB-383]